MRVEIHTSHLPECTPCTLLYSMCAPPRYPTSEIEDRKIQRAPLSPALRRRVEPRPSASSSLYSLGTSAAMEAAAGESEANLSLTPWVAV